MDNFLRQELIQDVENIKSYSEIQVKKISESRECKKVVKKGIILCKQILKDLYDENKPVEYKKVAWKLMKYKNRYINTKRMNALRLK